MRSSARAPASNYLKAFYASYLLADSPYILSKCELKLGKIEIGAEQKVYVKVKKEFADREVECIMPIFDSYEAKCWSYLVDFRYGREMASVPIMKIDYKTMAGFVNEVRGVISGSEVGVSNLIQEGFRRNSLSNYITRLRLYFLLHEKKQPEEIVKRLVGSSRMSWKGMNDIHLQIPVSDYMLGNVFDSLSRNVLLSVI